MGMPAHQPTKQTREQVGLLVAFGNSEKQIAQVIGIGISTLNKHYRHELETGLIKANYRVCANLYRQAIKDDPRAFASIKYWLECRANWGEQRATASAAEKLGKKEVAQIIAETAEVGTGWSGLVN